MKRSSMVSGFRFNRPLALFLPIAMASALLAGATPTPAHAGSPEEVHVNLSTMSGDTYHCKDPNKIYYFSGTTTKANVVVDKNKGSESKPIRIVLEGCTIDQRESGHQQPGIDLKHGSWAEITVAEGTTNIVKGFKGEGGAVWNDQGHAAINVDYAAHLTLTVNSSNTAGNTPELACYGGMNSAGIGGSDDKSGEIEIHMNGGDLLSYGGTKGAGIGAGNDSDDHKYIRIYGHGSIDAAGGTNGGTNGCGIGSGEGAKGDDITIIGDNDTGLEPHGRSLNINAYGVGNNAAIGYGQDDGHTITIKNCIVTATLSDTSQAACIGTGRYTHAEGDEGLKVSIDNCDIKTNGNKHSIGIGAGYGGAVKSIEITNSTYEGLNIGSGDVSGNYANAGHVHLISICNSTIDASSNNGTSAGNNNAVRSRAGIGSGPWADVDRIEITGNSHVTATGTDNAAGIGTGGVPDDFGSVLWSNGSVAGQINIVDSEVAATGGGGGAGIGAGKSGRTDQIYIKGSTVTATAGESSCGGAGIGGGFCDGVDSIHITSSKVTATGAGGAAGIGTAGNNGELGGNINGRIHAGSILIANGSDVTATGGKNGAGIGSGWGAYINTGDSQGIRITDSAVHAQGGEHGAGIGGGADGPDANTGDGDLNQLYIGGTCQIEAHGGEGAAGIGGGFDGFAENLTFDLTTDVSADANGNLTAGSYVKAWGGAGAAGIGAGACDNETGNDVDGIVINGGYIEAWGGGDYMDNHVSSGTAAAIGGGVAGGSLHNLTINGGYIKTHLTDGHNNKRPREIGHGGWNFSFSEYAAGHDTNIRINGGTLDVGSWTDECDIVVDGGTFIQPVEAEGHTVKSSDGSKLYRTSLYRTGFPAYENTQGHLTVDTRTSYGTHDVITDAEGGLFLMLPQSGEMEQKAHYSSDSYTGTTSQDGKGFLKMKTSVKLYCDDEQLVRGAPFTIRADDGGWAGASVEWEIANGKSMLEVVDQQNSCPGAFITLRATKMGTYAVKAHVNNQTQGADGNYFDRLYWSATGSYVRTVNKFDTEIHFLNNPSKVYDGDPIDDVEIRYGGTATPRIDYQDKNGKWSSTKPCNVGTYTVRARVSESGFYPAAEATMEVTVSKRSIVLSADSIQENSKGVNGFMVHVNNLVTSEGSLTVVAHEDGKPDQTRTYNASSFTQEDGGRSLFVDVDDFNLKYKTVFDVSFSNTYNYTETDPLQVTYDLPENDEEPVPEPKATRTLTASYIGGENGYDKFVSIVLTTNHPVDKDALSIQVVQDVAPGDCPDAASVAPTLNMSSIGDVTFKESSPGSGTYEASLFPKILNAGTVTLSFTIAESDDVEGARTQLDTKVLQSYFHLRTTVNGKTDETATYGKTDGLIYDYDKDYAQVFLEYDDTIDDVLSLGKDANGNKAPGYNASVSINELPDAAAAGTYWIGVTKQGADATIGDTTYPNLFYSRNYRLFCDQAKVTVEKAQLTLTAKDATGTVGAEPAYDFTCTGLAPWEFESAVLAASTKAALANDMTYASLAAGAYPNAITVVDAKLQDGMDANYSEDIRIENGDLTINKAAYEATLTMRSKTYDGTPLAASYEIVDTATGKLVEDASKVTLTYAKKDGDSWKELGSKAPVDAGTYRATLVVAGDVNHDELTVTTKATIDKASAPRVVVDDARGEYGGDEPAYTYRVEGLAGSDEAGDVVAATAVLDTKAADGGYADLEPGTYPGVITAHDVRLLSKNYEDGVTVANGTLTVAARETALKVDLSVASKTYDGKAVAAKTSVTGFDEGDEDLCAQTLTYFDMSTGEPQQLASAPVNAGSYRAELTVADATSADGRVQYRGGTATTDFKIAKADGPVVTAQDAHTVFHKQDPTYSYSVSGLVDGDSVDTVLASEPAPAAVLDTDKTDGRAASELDAGTYRDAVTVTGVALSDMGAHNYKKPRVVAGDLAVAKAQLALSFDVPSKLYNGKPLTCTQSAADPYTNEPVTIDGERVAFAEIVDEKPRNLDSAPSDAGSYRITYTVPDSANYLGGAITQDARIYRNIANPKTPALDAIELRDGLTVADEPIPADKDGGTWEWTKDAGSRKITEVGTATALAKYTPADTRNYTATYRRLTFTVYEHEVSPAPEQLELTLTAEDKTYDGEAATVTATAVLPSTGETVNAGKLTYYPINADGMRGEALESAPINAGAYEVELTVESTADYTGGSTTARYVIDRAAAPRLEVADACGTWRGDEPNYAFSVSGLVAADEGKDVLTAGTKATLDEAAVGGKAYAALDAGVYPAAITVANPQLNSKAGANYKNGITVRAGTLSVAPVTPSASVSVAEKSYDGDPAEVTVSIIDPTTDKQLEGSYNLTYYREKDGALTPLEEAPVNAGNCVAVVSAPAQTNYTACEARCSYRIAKAAPPELRVDSKTGQVGGAEPAYTYSVLGLKGADTAEAIMAPDTVAALDTAKTGGKTYAELGAGTYTDAITITDPRMQAAGNNNYESDITVVPGTLTVEPVVLNTGIAVDDKTYDGKPAVATVSITDATGADVAVEHTVRYYRLDGGERAEDLGSEAPKDAGRYEAVLHVSDDVNYTAADASCTFKISRHAAPVLHVADARGTWHGAEPAYTFEVEGLVEGDDANDIIAPAATAGLDSSKLADGAKGYAGLDAGTYADAITVLNAKLSEAGKVNYKTGVKVVPGTLTVDPAQLELSLDATSKVYDGTAAAVSHAVTDPATGQDLTDLGTLAYYQLDGEELTKLDSAPVQAGSYVAELTVAASSNYSATPVTASFTIYRAPSHPETPSLDPIELRDGLTFGDESIPADDSGTWAWVDGSRAITAAGTQQALALYTPKDTRNYLPALRMLSFEVTEPGTPEPEPEPKPEPEPDPTPDPEPKPDPMPDPTPDPEPDLTPDPKPEPTPDPEPNPDPNPEPSPNPQKPQLELTVDAASKAYDGYAAEVTTKAVDPSTGGVLVTPSVGTLTYYEIADGTATPLEAAPVNAGTYAAVYHVDESDEYAAGSAVATFQIYRAVPDPEVTPLPDMELRDGLVLADQELAADAMGTWA